MASDRGSGSDDAARSGSNAPEGLEEADAPAQQVPQGRLARFRRLAGLGATLGADVLRSGARRLTGGEVELLSRGTAEKLVATLGDMKGAAMKLGQAVSMEADLLTPEVRAVLARLQNQAPPMDAAAVARMVEEELGAPPDALFARFDAAPLAAASLGQVHRARLQDGREVAVKVQYPGVAQSLQGDLDNLALVARTMSLATRAGGLRVDGMAYFAELREQMLHELDYAREARLLTDFARAAEPLADLVVPRVVPARSSARVLTLELLEGETLRDFAARAAPAADRARVAAQLLRALWGPFFLAGVMHADPHPGNFLVLPDGRLGVLDFGAVKRFDAAFVHVHRRMLRHALGLAREDLVALAREGGFTLDLPDAEARPLFDGILEAVAAPMTQVPYDYATSDVVADLRRHFAKNAPRFLKVQPPADATLFFRATGGLVQNLKLLGGKGDFRAVFLALADLGA